VAPLIIPPILKTAAFTVHHLTTGPNSPSAADSFLSLHRYSLKWSCRTGHSSPRSANGTQNNLNTASPPTSVSFTQLRSSAPYSNASRA